MELAGHIGHMVLFSGDGDFRSLVEAVQRRGVRVSVVSTTSTQPPMIADELRRQADQFVDIVELQPKISRDPAERAARETASRGIRRNSCSAVQPRKAPVPTKKNPRVKFRVAGKPMAGSRKQPTLPATGRTC